MTYHVRIAGTDDVVFPADLARELGIEDGDSLVVEREGGGIVFKSYREVVRQGQRRFRAMVGDYSVDKFLAERRADWGED